ncbi:uncharacterized protein B0I36DRAFT_352456 [Microdochium trichocladiopsis]|uniref:Uncharacterized protein n=1 Tax=Microdochium trichocladiopsis TaxID=1682393 RepID=A0A9P9BMU3_9PEZI|nr:uncharacterized protein B0I36DRAFT_352456 [Microdochium trichocladiopsis]KAH7026623.1 hypothetical protein B0I36DRAFT_352456 [Microdochium trichocladiopsis]
MASPANSHAELVTQDFSAATVSRDFLTTRAPTTTSRTPPLFTGTSSSLSSPTGTPSAAAELTSFHGATVDHTTTRLAQPPLPVSTISTSPVSHDTSDSAIADFKPGGNQFWIIIGILIVGVIVLSACVLALSICRRRQWKRDHDVRDLVEAGADCTEPGSTEHNASEQNSSAGASSARGHASSCWARLGGIVACILTCRADKGKESAQPEQEKRCLSCGRLLEEGAQNGEGFPASNDTGNRHPADGETIVSTRDASEQSSWRLAVCQACVVKHSGITDRLRCGN